MNNIKNMRATLFIIIIIIIVWVILFFMDQKIHIIPLLCGKGINNISGEYYRFITGAMLHNNFIHLLANCLTLYWIGYYLEINIYLWNHFEYSYFIFYEYYNNSNPCYII